MRYALLVFLAALLLAILSFSREGLGAEAGSLYVPPCLDLSPKPRSQNPNGVTLMTGPASDGRNLMVLGYMRRFRPDLSLGFQFIGSDRNGYEGAAVGLQYHFGDPQ